MPVPILIINNKIRFTLADIIVLFLVILFLMFSSQVFSHPASKVTLLVEGKVLHITVNHNVGNSENHYINEILVFLNDKEIIRQMFFIQTGDMQKVSYMIPSLKAGDKVTVKTNCSRGGKRSGTITVEPAS